MKNIFTPQQEMFGSLTLPPQKNPFAFQIRSGNAMRRENEFFPYTTKTVFHFSCISPNRMCRKDVSIESRKLLSDVGRKSARVNMRRNKNILQCIIFLQSMSSVSEIKKNSTLSCYPRSDKRKNIKIN